MIGEILGEIELCPLNLEISPVLGVSLPARMQP